MTTTQTPRDLCKCGSYATITIGTTRLCRACSYAVCREACRILGRNWKRHEIGTVLK
jgi:hypothetical protein